MAIGQKLSRMLSTPAVSVVTETKHNGANVTHAYRTFPMLMMMVVPTASATEASSWFAIPNIGQIVLMLPVQMKYPQVTTTSSVATIEPGSNSCRAIGL